MLKFIFYIIVGAPMIGCCERWLNTKKFHGTVTAKTQLDAVRQITIWLTKEKYTDYEISLHEDNNIAFQIKEIK